jgi:hypothetical protein
VNRLNRRRQMRKREEVAGTSDGEILRRRSLALQRLALTQQRVNLAPWLLLPTRLDFAPLRRMLELEPPPARNMCRGIMSLNLQPRRRENLV